MHGGVNSFDVAGKFLQSVTLASGIPLGGEGRRSGVRGGRGLARWLGASGWFCGQRE